MKTISRKQTRRRWLMTGAILAVLTAALNFTAVAAETNARLASMTGVWTGPPLDSNGVPKGFILQGDIQVPVAASGFGPAGGFVPAAWPDGVVPFQFDANVSSDNRAAINSAGLTNMAANISSI